MQLQGELSQDAETLFVWSVPFVLRTTRTTVSRRPAFWP